jgi:hypothetical protein
VSVALFGIEQTTLFGVAAAVSSISGVVLAILSHRAGAKSAKEQAAKETHEQLLAARAEAEALSAELHKLRLERDAEGPR